MSEEQADYSTQPAAIIESPRKVKALQDNGLTEYKVWGWVKMSANFIKHIRILKGAKLSVWNVIALSIDESGFCNLSVPVIASLTDYSQSEVRQTIRELDEMGYLSVTRADGKKNVYDPEFVARSSNSPTDYPTRKTTPPVDKTPPVGKGKRADDPSSPSEEISVPTYKELKELIQKEINMNTDKSPWEIADGAYKHLSEKGLKISGKQKQELREYLSSLEGSGEEPKPTKTQTTKKKEDKVNTDIKTVARSRGVSEDMIKFIDRACKAFGFAIMQLDEVSLVVYGWIMDQESKGQTIEQFADWARLDEQGKFIGKYRNSAGAIRNDWARAFGIKPADDRTSLIRRMT